MLVISPQYSVHSGLRSRGFFFVWVYIYIHIIRYKITKPRGVTIVPGLMMDKDGLFNCLRTRRKPRLPMFTNTSIPPRKSRGRRTADMRHPLHPKSWDGKCDGSLIVSPFLCVGFFWWLVAVGRVNLR